VDLNPNYENNLVALRRIEGQVRGLQRMIKDHKHCGDILDQIAAVKGALYTVQEKILEKQFQSALAQISATRSAKRRQHELHEILELIHRTRG
jgi:DNA-binding FrmR family transcriptional regulator